MTFRVADAATRFRVEPVTQRARKPNRIFGGRDPPEGVEALWAFHTLHYSTCPELCVFFLNLPGRTPTLIEVLDGIDSAGNLSI